MMKDHPEESTAYYSQQICTSLSQLSSYLDWNVIDEVLKLIHDSDNVAFFGTQFLVFYSAIGKAVWKTASTNYVL